MVRNDARKQSSVAPLTKSCKHLFSAMRINYCAKNTVWGVTISNNIGIMKINIITPYFFYCIVNCLAPYGLRIIVGTFLGRYDFTVCSQLGY